VTAVEEGILRWGKLLERRWCREKEAIVAAAWEWWRREHGGAVRVEKSWLRGNERGGRRGRGLVGQALTGVWVNWIRKKYTVRLNGLI